MEWRRFTFFNLFGGLIWAAGVLIAGYSLARAIPPDVLDRYFLIIVFVVIVVSLLPALIHLWREERHEIFALIKTRILRRPAAEKHASEENKDDPAK
jgi:membrane protein DedA with SNARE-associated domain